MLSTANDSPPVSTNKFIPVDQDKNIVQYKNNPAHMLGVMHETQLFWKRNGYFRSVAEHSATLLSNGKLALQSISQIPFIQGTIADAISYGYANPCPPGNERLIAHNAALKADGKPEISAYDKLSPEDSQSFMISPYSVTTACQDMCLSIWPVCFKTPRMLLT